MAQTVAYFTGLETGDASEIVTLGSGSAVQSTTVHSGAYAYQQASTQSVLKTGLNAAQSVFRCYFLKPQIPASTNAVIRVIDSTSTATLNVDFLSTGKLRVGDAGTTLGLTQTTGPTVLSSGTWYLLEVALDVAAGGVVIVWLNGSIELNLTHTKAGNNTDRWNVNAAASPNFNYYDDIRIDVGGVAEIGAGRVLARQPKTGVTPTYNQWVKSSGTDAGAMWNQTPFNATLNCNDTTSGDAQTGVIEQFSVVQSGHGTEVVASYDIVNACKAAFVGYRLTSGNPSIRRIIGGVTTDTAKTMTAADAYYDDGIWTTTTANLDTAEVGCLKAADSNYTEIEDVWLMADVSPGTPPSGFGALLDGSRNRLVIA